jgi:cytidylate kinase
MNEHISIAIDGPAGAGKSTIAKRLAVKLGCIYVDTGALCRTIAYSLLKSGKDYNDVKAVVAHLPGISVNIAYKGDTQIVLLDGEDVSSFIRTPEVSNIASVTSAIPEVRAYLLGLQRRLAEENSVVMDGRDIATVVLPNAKVKIFLTASAEERARRRFIELQEKGIEANYDEVLADIKDRDYRDSHREVAPLKQADDAVLVDTTDKDLEQAVLAMEEAVKQQLAK